MIRLITGITLLALAAALSALATLFESHRREEN